MVKKIHPETGGWFLEAYSVMINFRAKATNSIANGTNSIAKLTNSFANGTNSIAKATNSQLPKPVSQYTALFSVLHIVIVSKECSA